MEYLVCGYVCSADVCAIQKEKALNVLLTEFFAEMTLYFGKEMRTRTGKVLEKKYIKLEKFW